jgi:hypothetical protein
MIPRQLVHPGRTLWPEPRNGAKASRFEAVMPGFRQCVYFYAVGVNKGRKQAHGRCSGLIRVRSLSLGTSAEVRLERHGDPHPILRGRGRGRRNYRIRAGSVLLLDPLRSTRATLWRRVSQISRPTVEVRSRAPGDVNPPRPPHLSRGAARARRRRVAWCLAPPPRGRRSASPDPSRPAAS